MLVGKQQLPCRERGERKGQGKLLFPAASLPRRARRKRQEKKGEGGPGEGVAVALGQSRRWKSREEKAKGPPPQAPKWGVVPWLQKGRGPPGPAGVEFQGGKETRRGEGHTQQTPGEAKPGTAALSARQAYSFPKSLVRAR